MSVTGVVGIFKVLAMLSKGCSRGIIYPLVYISFVLSACANTSFTNSEMKNEPPEIWLTSGPVEGDTLYYKVHFYWGGWDPDGEIAWFEFVIAHGNPFGFNPEDTTGIDKWSQTNKHDSVIVFTADTNPNPYGENELYTRSMNK